MINRLIVHNLRGFSETELKIDFNSDLNLVTGKNGSGKTTLLKLVWYLISGNIHIAAAETPFSFASILTDDYGMTVDLSDNANPIITVERGGEERVFRNRSLIESDQDDLPDFSNDILEEASRYAEDYGRSLYFPTFRRVEGGYTIRRDTRTINTRTGRAIRGGSPLEDGLQEISRRLSNMQHTFVCSISTYDIVELVLDKYNTANERFSHAQQELSADIIGQIRHYEEKDGTLLLNTADEVLRRIKIAIQHVDKQRVDMMSSLNAVQDLVKNIFDKRGISFGTRYAFGDKTEAVFSEHLSAGEKQMLSFICYNAFFDNCSIFIDEPELSLHIDWQRQLFPILESQATTNQFIVATHSPFIYSKYPEKEILLSNDRGD